MTNDPDIALWTPVVEMLDSLDSARVTGEYAEAEFRGADPFRYFWVDFWAKRSEWHMANAIGWASR